jgi:type IV pilus assembly protein PilC
MPRYKYKAYNTKGRPIKGIVSAVNEVDLYNQLQAAGLELASCSLDDQKAGIKINLFKKKVKTRDLIQFFMGMEQMQGAGVPLLDTLNDIKESTDNQTLKDALTDISREVTEGSSLSDSMGKHPKIFSNLYTALISAGEGTGDLVKSYRQLLKFLKWVDDMQSKIKKATRYPMILGAAVVLTVAVMMGVVVPQIVGFIKNIDQELPFLTVSLMATSDFIQANWLILIIAPVILFILFKLLRKYSEEFRYRTDALFLEAPVFGPIIRKINIARYSQTFGALYSSGIDVISCLKTAQKTVTNMAILEALDSTLMQVETGATLSKAFAASGEFPNLVIRMVRIGEESGNLTAVFEQISEFYTKDVDEAVSGMITMIEPALTLIMGGMIIWIAAGVFGPIYSSFEKLDF